MANEIPNSSLSSPSKLIRRFSQVKVYSEFKEIFNLVDRDGGGTITAKEMGKLIETLGISATPEEVKHLIAEIDDDRNGAIDFQGEEILQ